METSFKQSLKAKAHHLKPVILVGAKGLTEAVINEADNALLTHELIKIKINGAEKEDRVEMAATLSQKLNAELVQMMGNIVTLYRENLDK